MVAPRTKETPAAQAVPQPIPEQRKRARGKSSTTLSGDQVPGGQSTAVVTRSRSRHRIPETGRGNQSMAPWPGTREVPFLLGWKAVGEPHARRRQDTRNAFRIETAPCQLRNVFIVYEEVSQHRTQQRLVRILGAASRDPEDRCTVISTLKRPSALRRAQTARAKESRASNDTVDSRLPFSQLPTRCEAKQGINRPSCGCPVRAESEELDTVRALAVLLLFLVVCRQNGCPGI
jgi:hypothetical protein